MENVIETALIRVPVSKLAISPLNVRKKQGTGIEELAALIASQGLIHNLVVTEQVKKGKKTGKYEVVAGGRRLAALKLLVSDGRLSKEHEVDCRVVGAGGSAGTEPDRELWARRHASCRSGNGLSQPDASRIIA